MRLRPIGLVLMSLALTGCAVAPTSPPSTPSAGGSTASKPAVATDIDGDGIGDSLARKRVNGHWELTVTTASGSARHVFDSAGGPDDPEFVGVAPLDPVPGSEVMYNGPGEGTNFRVLTWRNGGLVAVPSPKGAPSWVTADEFDVSTGYAFSEKDGQRKLITSETETQVAGPVDFVEYAGVSGAWTEQRRWTENLSSDAVAALCPGFCGVTVTPVPRH